MYRSSVTGQALGASKRASVYRYAQRKRFRNTLLGALLFVLLGLVLQSVTIGPARAQTSHPDLADLSLEELLNIEVTSVSKRAENMSQAAAAIYVLTADDVRRAGAGSIPEALRMVPGLQVAQMGSNRFAVTARGFNGTFANKLLVMIDGRSVYTPLFSGVFWDVQDVVLEDIDRIEVIRGPGATLWGANAVNGVINIITKPSERTQGLYARAYAGSVDRTALEGRYGFRLNESSSMRVSARRYALNQFDDLTGTNSGLQTDVTRGGFRYDAGPNERNSITVQGDIYSGESAIDYILPTIEIPYQYPYSTTVTVEGGNLLARWQHDLSSQLEGTLQAYFDRTTRDDPIIKEERSTYDVDYQQEWNVGSRTLFMWGAGYRSSADEIDATSVSTALPSSTTIGKWSGFVQGEFVLQPARLSMTAGSKIEHNDYTGTEVQPSIRTIWTPTERHSMWAAASRAVRTPSRGERGGLVWLGVIPPLSLANPTPAPMRVMYTGTEGFDSEVSESYEIGYRTQASPRLWMDAAAFYTHYTSLIMAQIGAPYPDPSGDGSLILPFTPENGRQAWTHGVEIAADWQVARQVRLRSAYTYFGYKVAGADVWAAAGVTAGMVLAPRNQFSLQSVLSPTKHVTLNVWTRYVDRIADANIDSYVTMDTRLGLNLGKAVEIAVVGKDLLKDTHQEFTSDILGFPLAPERRILFSIAWRH